MKEDNKGIRIEQVNLKLDYSLLATRIKRKCDQLSKHITINTIVIVFLSLLIAVGVVAAGVNTYMEGQDTFTSTEQGLLGVLVGVLTIVVAVGIFLFLRCTYITLDYPNWREIKHMARTNHNNYESYIKMAITNNCAKYVEAPWEFIEALIDDERDIKGLYIDDEKTVTMEYGNVRGLLCEITMKYDIKEMADVSDMVILTVTESDVYLSYPRNDIDRITVINRM